MRNIEIVIQKQSENANADIDLPAVEAGSSSDVDSCESFKLKSDPPSNLGRRDENMDFVDADACENDDEDDAATGEYPALSHRCTTQSSTDLMRTCLDQVHTMDAKGAEANFFSGLVGILKETIPAPYAWHHTGEGPRMRRVSADAVLDMVLCQTEA